MKAADYKSIVSVILQEGLAGPMYFYIISYSHDNILDMYGGTADILCWGEE